MAGQFSYAIAESESTKSANHAQWSVGGTRQRRQTTEEGKRVCAFGCEENEPVAILSPLPSFLPSSLSFHLSIHFAPAQGTSFLRLFSRYFRRDDCFVRKKSS